MNIQTSKVQARGQITIPQALREEMDFAEGNLVTFQPLGRASFVVSKLKTDDLPTATHGVTPPRYSREEHLEIVKKIIASKKPLWTEEDDRHLARLKKIDTRKKYDW
ncbi:MAG: AbrB/MazE/SpoVT family DNA-binding domain-containing protein [Pseudomonadales bacterium]|nr:AbrB/MazE/SpoVT family DNA-binding domain-containing protein [Candidatus Woesebacteria bacterium]MCB9801479.1 AbrB/MazE/SpoVT family DNA-binding domain-containing protein [Pseudomonadales bacterium]